MKKLNFGIDFKEEIKEYKKYRKYGKYLEWRDHILKLISTLDIKSMENLKRFCLNNENAEKQGLTIFLAMIAIFLPIYVSDIFNQVGFQVVSLCAYGPIAVVVTFLVTLSYFSYTLSKDFYRDIAEIVQAKIDSMPEKHLLLIETKEENSEVLK